MKASWEVILSPLAPVFFAPSYRIFVRLCCAWVLCPGRHTVTRLYQLAELERKKAHDAYHRFLRAGAWSLSALWRLTALLLVAALRPEGPIPLDLDDTLFHKSGRRIEDASWWRDAVSSTGQKVLQPGRRSSTRQSPCGGYRGGAGYFRLPNLASSCPQLRRA